MRVRTVGTIFRKEMLDTLRDKRALVAMLGVPIVLYPALFIVGIQAALLQTNRLERTPSTVAIDAREVGEVRSWVAEIPMLKFTYSRNAEEELRQGKIDAILRIESETDRILAEGGSAQVVVQYDATDAASNRAADRIAAAFEEKAAELLTARLDEAGLEPAFVVPLVVTRANIASPKQVAGSIIGTIVPLIMVVMVGVGAFYPAVDLTAGEKERGTFETLLATPAAKSDIVTGKFLAVFSLAMTTGLLNLGSMALTLGFQLSQLPQTAEVPFELHVAPSSVVLMVVVLVPLAFLISAAMMSIAIYARNFKEAQNYVTPFFLLIVFPAAMSSVPGAELTATTQFIPIGNVSLLFKGLMTGAATADQVFAVLLSTGAYALLALVFAAALFQREDVVLADDHGVSLPLRRSEFPPRALPTPGMALTAYATSLILLFYVGTVVQTREPVAGILLTQWALILLPPIAIAWYGRARMRTTFALRLPGVRNAIGSLLVIVASVVLILEFGAWYGRAFPIPPELQHQLMELFDVIESRAGLLGLLGLVALSPAICEEALFRGMLLSSLRRLPIWAAVVIVGVLFGAMHLDVHRFAGTALSGFILSYLVWRSGSLFVGILGHFSVNASALAMQALADQATLVEGELSWLTREVAMRLAAGRDLPLWLILSALAVFGVGVAVIEHAAWRAGRRAHTATGSVTAR